ncbi:MAG TPA: endonuclease domain-containing protein [Methylomirabilota bacterium]|jgi:very-short-patch-repair endonuclease|nr:endonuclease domain-containing protein [Methylomirabilota bacterium]
MIRYDAKLKDSSRALRTHLTDSEQLLWSQLRRKQLLGVQFYRQKPLDRFIVDFYAPSVRLVVEVDGSQHFVAEQVEYDSQRTTVLESQGLQVLRFTNHEVLQETEAVVEAIYRAVLEAKNPPRFAPPPLQKGAFKPFPFGKKVSESSPSDKEISESPPLKKERS